MLDLDVDPERPAGIQRLAERGKPRRQLRRQEAAERAKSGHFAVMVDDYVAVGGEVDVQLDPVRAQVPRGNERRDGVLPRQLSRSPVGEDLGQDMITCLHRAARSRKIRYRSPVIDPSSPASSPQYRSDC